jgi:hypothetical protein
MENCTLREQLMWFVDALKDNSESQANMIALLTMNDLRCFTAAQIFEPGTE